MSATKTAQQSLLAKFYWASAQPATLDQAGIDALTFQEIQDVYEGDRPKLVTETAKKDTYGGPLYYASSQSIDTVDFEAPRQEGATPADLSVSQAAVKASAEALAPGTLRISTPNSDGSYRDTYYFGKIVSFSEELNGPTDIQSVMFRFQAEKLQDTNAVGFEV